MYCASCGAKIKDGARFCSACGKPLDVDDAPANAQQPLPSGTPKASADRKATSDPAVSRAEGPSPVPSDHMSFAAFMMQRRQIGRFAVPTFVTILAAIIFTAGVAYALVKAYEAFVLPQAQQQEQPAAVEKKSSKKKVAATKKKARKAYEGVVARYEDFASYCEQKGAGAASYDDWAQGRGGDSGLGQIFVYNNQTAPGFLSYYYAFDDLSGDGIDELLVGFVDAQNDISAIVGAYCFVDGEAVSVMPSSEMVEGSSNMTNQYDGFIAQGESQVITVCKDGIVKFTCSQDCNQADFYISLTAKGPEVVDAVQIQNKEFDRQNGAYLVRTVEDGGKPQEAMVQGREEACRILDELAGKYPEADIEMPSASSDMWKAFKGVEPSEGSLKDGSGTADDRSGASQAPSEAASDSSDDGEAAARGDGVIADMDAFIANAKRELIVPDDASITFKVADKPNYWEGAATYVWYVEFYKDGKVVASAECGSEGYPCRSIMAYHESW